MATAEPTDEHLRELGNIALRAAALDYAVEVMLWALIGAGQEIGASITIGQPFSWRIDRLKTLARARLQDGQLVEDIFAFAERASAAQTRRNQMLHSMWLKGDESASLQRIKFRLKGGRPTVDKEALTVEELKKIGLDLYNRFAEVTQLLPRFPKELIDGLPT